MSVFEKILLGVAGMGLVFIVFITILPYFLETTYSAQVAVVEESQVVFVPEVEVVAHLDTPDPLKALYMTACVASTGSWRQSLKTLITETELNAVVIDIKDSTGVVSFANNFPKATTTHGCIVPDLKEFIKELHTANIYVIGRISVFQDPSYVKVFPALAVKRKDSEEVWKDHKGLAFVDVGAKPYWDYIVELSKESYKLGFDELNFDYVRYPSDGNMQDARYSWAVGTTTKQEMLEEFFKYLSESLEETGAVLSADLFGMTTTQYDDMGIGQVIERAMPYFDYIAPMVYPSHYPPNWNGYANPALYPYDVIKISMRSAVDREAAWRVLNGVATSTPSKIRPWLQDFNLGATYDAEKVQAQIRATYDSGLNSWMIWNAGNKYTREALQSD